MVKNLKYKRKLYKRGEMEVSIDDGFIEIFIDNGEYNTGEGYTEMSNIDSY